MVEADKRKKNVRLVCILESLLFNKSAFGRKNQVGETLATITKTSSNWQAMRTGTGPFRASLAAYFAHFHNAAADRCTAALAAATMRNTENARHN
jgi:hypothetical protein